MYDYSNLSDHEFEKLCSDILSRELNTHLRYFGPGRDGGIDLVDNIKTKNIVIQIKHYSKSSFSSLKTSLKKEIEKIKNMTPIPKNYYICTSQELTAANILEIYEMFSEYMESDKNIFTKLEIDQFLNKPNNQDILRKNFKLWLVADQLLTQVINRSVFIDGEVLLEDLTQDFKFFVQTKLFNECIDILEKTRRVMLIGEPGVGKTITSKMLTFYFVKKGYQIRYTTNGDISNLKSSFNENKNVKEIILIDDCFGQYYFKLKAWQDSELISLMKYISMNENKILILNSRITVLNEAQGISRQLRDYFENGKLNLKVINMNEINKEEKSEIFYNHLVKNEIPKEYYLSIKNNRNYKKIIFHNNYNPRIIEYVTHKQRYFKVKPEEFFSYINQTLDRPEEVWAEEFKYGLSVEDRIFMYTLFSLTDTYIDINILEECFLNTIKKQPNIDYTVNHFVECKRRLSNSLIKIIDDYSNEVIGVLNPSINDYIKHVFTTTPVLKDMIIKHALYIEQIENLVENSKSYIQNLVRQGEIINYKSIDYKISVYIAWIVTQEDLLIENYKNILVPAINFMESTEEFFNTRIKKITILTNALENKQILDFYGIKKALSDDDFIHLFISSLKLDDVVKFMSELKNYGKEYEYLYEELKDILLDKINDYLEDYNFFQCIADKSYLIDNYYLEDFPSMIIESIYEDVWDELSLINVEDIEYEINDAINYNLEFHDIDSLVSDYFKQGHLDYESEYFNKGGYDSASIDMVDIIFDREIKI
ncbi:restriction endonuclease [Solibacillus sp. CAU 1738]|uniref:nSTAND3 domain-containing NTPase n=1 Tax=Solibacillus sp. CAU 1738 TaxID=3140363 RepID=UPI003260BD6B